MRDSISVARYQMCGLLRFEEPQSENKCSDGTLQGKVKNTQRTGGDTNKPAHTHRQKCMQGNLFAPRMN